MKEIIFFKKSTMSTKTLNRNYWSKAEVNELQKCIVRNSIGQLSVKQDLVKNVALKLNRSFNGCRIKADKLRVKLEGQQLPIVPQIQPAVKPLQFHLPIEKLEIKEGNLIISVDASSLIAV